MFGKILIVDDEETLADTLGEVLADEGYESVVAGDGVTALSQIQSTHFDIAICDIKLPDIDGIELLRKISEVSPQTFVMMITAFGSVQTAVSALWGGAVDYITKPFEFDDVLMKIGRILEYRRSLMAHRYLRQEIQRDYAFEHDIVARSLKMQQIFDRIERISPTESNVLILGESGTGKELVARAIHADSPRDHQRFVPVNCGAIPENLLESQLFGHAKGAFTGAVSYHPGLFRTANGGTIFLDEIGKLPLNLQVKLLRTIEEKEILPIGETQPVKVDVRIIAASNRMLAHEVEHGRFREDLFYRLNVVEIVLPPLRERKDDIPLLANHFIRKYNRELNKRVRGIGNDAMRAMLSYGWKGNVRELENVIERAIIPGDGELITVEDLPANLLPRDSLSTEDDDNLKTAVKFYEIQHIIGVLKKTNDHKRGTAALLGISLSSLYRKIEELGIEVNS